MPQNDNAPKVMPDLAALALVDVIYYQRFFDRIGEMMNVVMAFDPASNPVAVIAPGCSPCIELTGLQWPSEAVLMGPDLGGDQLVWGRSNVNTVSGSGIGSPAPDASAVVPIAPTDAPVAGGVVPPASSLAQPPATGRKPAPKPSVPGHAGTANADGVYFPEPTDDLAPKGAALAYLRFIAAQTVAMKPFSTPQQDYDILRLSELQWPISSIVPEVGLTDVQVRSRFRALTNNRQHAASDVMAALKQMYPELATGADDDAAA